MGYAKKLLELWLSTAGRDPSRRCDLIAQWLEDAEKEEAAAESVKVSRSTRHKPELD